MADTMTPPPYARPFLATIGWENADILPLAGDASFRRYFRVQNAHVCAVLMDAPPPYEDPRPFIQIAEWLTAKGFAAPKIIAQDVNVGLVLLEDFGDVRMREALDADPAREADLYREVVTLLVDLHSRPPPELPVYDNAVYHREVSLFTEWYCPALGLAVDQVAFQSAWDEVLPLVEEVTHPVMVLRDYHAENIMLIAEPNHKTRLGLLDFQDALVGHPAYDLVSLLQDARRNVAQELEAAMLAYYKISATHALNFDAAYAILGAQRNTKILGIFTRLWKRDNKPHYRHFQPRVWRYLERNLAHPALAPVKAWFNANVPQEARADAWISYVD